MFQSRRSENENRRINRFQLFRHPQSGRANTSVLAWHILARGEVGDEPSRRSQSFLYEILGCVQESRHAFLIPVISLRLLYGQSEINVIAFRMDAVDVNRAERDARLQGIQERFPVVDQQSLGGCIQ